MEKKNNLTVTQSSSYLRYFLEIERLKHQMKKIPATEICGIVEYFTSRITRKKKKRNNRL